MPSLVTSPGSAVACWVGRVPVATPRSAAFMLPLLVALSYSAAAALATPPADRPVPPRLDDAVERGLAYLAKHQHADGSFDVHPAGPGGDEGGGLEVSKKSRHAITGLSLLAFLSAGHTPDVGRYGITVRNATDFLTAAVPDDGYVGKLDDKGMYAQAIVTLALAEAYGVEPDATRRPKEHAALGRLVGVILKAQDVKKQDVYAGGWRYTPDAPDSDLSLSGWAALGLRAAQDAGVSVPKDSIARAAEFVARCYSKDQKGFAYQPGNPARTSATGTGVLCLYLLSDPERPEVAAGARYLAEHPVEDAPQFPYYAMYYATQAAWQADDDTWAAVAKVTLDRLIKSQASDGGWPPDGPGQEPGRVYRTAMGVLTLAVPYRILPIYQR